MSSCMPTALVPVTEAMENVSFAMRMWFVCTMGLRE